MQAFFKWFLRTTVFIFFVLILYHTTTHTIQKLNSKPAQPVFATAAERERQLECLVKNIYYEAASEPFEGKVAVAQVTINRANSNRYPNDICKVVFQKNVFYNKVVCQFTWYCEKGNLPIKVNNDAYKESVIVARKVLLEDFRLPSLHSAMYYHADYVNPNWNLPKITKIGRHIFYGERL